LPSPLFASFFVDKCHGCTEFDGVAGEPGDVDYFGPSKLILEFRNASLIDVLLRFSGLISRILGKIWFVRDSFPDAFRNVRSLPMAMP
jgi:hypothetical protein